MPLRLCNLFKLTENIESLIQWLFQLGLVLELSGVSCNFCEKGRFGLRKDSSFSTDQCCWRCSNKACGKKVSIRQGSWFFNSNLTLETIVLLTYFWVYRAEQEFVQHKLGISHTTIVDWYNFSREVCICILENFSQQIGGPGRIVEIDESKFGKRKFHKGRRVDGVWVFGGIERETKKCFFKCVADRTANTLVSIIKDHILPGTTIYSDCWKAYSSLNSEGFSHLTVNHSVNFVDPETGTHTNTIESTWRALKKSLPKHGTTKNLYDTYFAQYCVRKQFLIDAEDPFLEFLQLIKKVYKPSFEPTDEEIETFRKRKAEKNPPVKNTKVARLPLSTIQINTSTSSLDDFEI